MNRKLTFLFSFAVFFLMWCVFGFLAAAPRAEIDAQAAAPALQSTVVSPEATNSAGIPVTGKQEPVLTEIIVFYGLIGLTTLFLILALLNVVNRSTGPTRPDNDSSHKPERG